MDVVVNFKINFLIGDLIHFEVVLDVIEGIDNQDDFHDQNSIQVFKNIDMVHNEIKKVKEEIEKNLLQDYDQDSNIGLVMNLGINEEENKVVKVL